LLAQLKTFKASSLFYTKEETRSELPRNLNNYLKKERKKKMNGKSQAPHPPFLSGPLQIIQVTCEEVVHCVIS
jgi:hypothetical protein